MVFVVAYGDFLAVMALDPVDHECDILFIVHVELILDEIRMVILEFHDVAIQFLSPPFLNINQVFDGLVCQRKLDEFLVPQLDERLRQLGLTAHVREYSFFAANCM